MKMVIALGAIGSLIFSPLLNAYSSVVNTMHPFSQFLSSFMPQVEEKSYQVNLASWILETTGSEDAATLKAKLDTELRLLFNNQEVFEKLLKWDRDPTLTDPLLKRELNVLIRTFKPNLIPKKLLEQIAEEEAQLALLYSNFRPQVDGKSLSENDIQEILKKENDPIQRKKAWEASKQIGSVLAPKILSLVSLRNDAARCLGYSDYFAMQLDLQEVDEKWLFATLESLERDSEKAYQQVLSHIEEKLSMRYGVKKEEIGPWGWSDPFCQEDPLDTKELDELAQDIDILDVCRKFYLKMGIDVDDIMKRSDNFERAGKNQHAFCIHMDRKGDIRTLNNIKPTIRWMETVLHETGHAVYEKGLDSQLPWLLREPPHMITTEAMALMAGRQAYRFHSLRTLLGGESKAQLMRKAEESLVRRQLICCRWVLVMTYFERELYRKPNQDLNQLWWQMVGKFQKIKVENRLGKSDWAAKYHMGLAPVYYFSYLLGELFASTMEEMIVDFASPKTGIFLNDKLFKPGDSFSWNQLIEHVTGKPLEAKHWLQQFAKAK